MFINQTYLHTESDTISCTTTTVVLDMTVVVILDIQFVKMLPYGGKITAGMQE